MSHRMRPWKSVAPPGVNGSTRRTGFAGHADSCARARGAMARAGANLRSSLLFKRVEYRTHDEPPAPSHRTRRDGAAGVRAAEEDVRDRLPRAGRAARSAG